MQEQAKTCCGGACRSGGGRTCVLSVLSLPFRLALGGLFLFAAYNKLFVENGPKLFAASVQAFKVLDPAEQPGLFQLVVFVTPWVEIVAGLALVLGLWTRAAAGVLSCLLVLFLALIVQVLVRGLPVDCGCFGKLSPFCPPKVSSCNIVQNSILLVMAGIIMASRRSALSVDSMMKGACGCGKACGCGDRQNAAVV